MPREILFVVGQDILTPADAAAQQRMTGLGFTVVVRSGAAVRASDATGRQLVVISSTVKSTDVGTSLRDITVPVMVWEPALFDDMRMTCNCEGKDFGSKDRQQKLDIVMPGHPIATDAGLPAGLVTVVTAKDRFSWGKPADSADVVATLPEHPELAAIFAYETGDALIGGQPAPARRLGIFLNDRTAERLNPAGWRLFDAAVRWAAGPGCVAIPWYADADSDGYGNTGTTQLSCTRPTVGGIDWVTVPGDCNDVDDAIHPGAPELCDGIDQSCNGIVDSDAVWFVDNDADGWGTSVVAGQGCPAPLRSANRPGDCNDLLDFIRPDAIETCDGFDQDCDGLIDDSPSDGHEYYRDADGDGFGDANSPVRVCAVTPPAGTVLNDDDCDDANPAAFPGAPEIPGNGVDENCDGVAN